MLKMAGWLWFLKDDKPVQFDSNKCGKWMSFFEDQDYAIQICQKAIDESACFECKCSDLELQGGTSGVICFYLECDDVEAHKKIIRFMIENNLIRKTKSGRFYNNCFKLDSQTHAGEYGTDFESKIKLEEFIDLNTGKWIHK